MELAEGNVGLAFALVIGAGLCTCLGSLMVFCSNLANTQLLAGSLGVSAGVMLYVSFGEIFMSKSVDAFNEHYSNAGYPDADGQALRSATYCFFGGMAFIALLNSVVSYIEHRFGGKDASSQQDMPLPQAAPIAQHQQLKVIDTLPQSTSAQTLMPKASETVSTASESSPDSLPADPEAQQVVIEASSELNLQVSEKIPLEIPNNVQEIIERSGHHNGLNRMGIMTGVAIAIHNFPEGLATFVAALGDPNAGFALALAIALHNIPEGVCVAMPVYYATGSKWKGFFWSFLSGITEPIGGVVGYLILWNSVTPLTYAILFGMVGGMMVYISLRELLPMALKYDPEDKVTTMGLFAGMVVMAASLLVFTA